MRNKILSIQSKLIYGYVGSNVAELAIQLHGLDPISFPTVLLSVHTGHQPVYGDVIPINLFDELITGIEAINIIDDVKVIISGYIKTKEAIDSLTRLVERHPDKTYVCDPVMGDTGGLYIPEDIARYIIEKLVPLGDILTPNFYEMEFMLGEKINSLDNLVTLVKKHAILSEKTLVITSSVLDDSPKDKIETIIISDDRVERIHSEKVDMEIIGTGDLFTAILAAQLTLGKDVYAAVAIAKTHISNIMRYVKENNLPEMNADSLIRHITREY